MDTFRVCACLDAESAEKKVPRGRYCSPAEDDSGQIENCERGFSGSMDITRHSDWDGN